MAQTGAQLPQNIEALRFPFEREAGGYANALAELPAPACKTAHQKLDV